MAQEQTKLDDAARSRAVVAAKDLQLEYPENDQKGVSQQYAADLAAVENLHTRTVGARSIDVDPVNTKYRHDEAKAVYVGKGERSDVTQTDVDWAEMSARLGDDGTHRPLDAAEYEYLAKSIEDVHNGAELDKRAPGMSATDQAALTAMHETNKAKMVEVAADVGRLHNSYQEPPFKDAELRTAYVEAHAQDLAARAQQARQFEELDRTKLAQLDATASTPERELANATAEASKDARKNAEMQASLASYAAQAERLPAAEREAFRKEVGLDADAGQRVDVAENLAQAQREADAEKMREELGLPADYGKQPVDVAANFEKSDRRTLELSEAAAAKFDEYQAKTASYQDTQATADLREGHEINRLVAHARAQEDRLRKGEITPAQIENDADAQQGRDYSEALDRARTRAVEVDAEANGIEASKPDQAQGQPAPRSDNEIEDFEAGAAAQARRNAVPDDVSKQFPPRGNGNVKTHYYQHDPDRVAFVDKGDKLQTPRDFDQQGVRAMVDVADARGWDEIKVHGAESFRRQVYLEAARRGIEVKGYKPTEAERQVADAASAKRERNQAAGDAFANAADRQAKAEAAREHPELAKAYAIEAAAAKFAKQAGWSADAQQRFQSRVHDAVERDIREGKKLEQMEVRDRKVDRSREPEAVRER